MPNVSNVDPNAAPNKPLFLTPAELSERWGIPAGTLSQARYHKKGAPYVRLGGAIRYRLADIIAYEKARSVAA
jgi:hypothetical protein